MRTSGILMPVFSLPSKYGIGCFSKEAYQFVDFLKESGQKNWQVLPLGQTSYGDSPYQSFSSFAGNPYFIDLEQLVEQQLLTKAVTVLILERIRNPLIMQSYTRTDIKFCVWPVIVS